MTVRRRLIIGVTAALIVTLALSGLLTVTLVRGRLLAEVDADLRSRVAVVSSAVDELGALPLPGQGPFTSPGPGIRTPPRIDTAVTVFDSQGNVVSFLPDGTVENPASGPDLSSVDPGDLIGEFESVGSSDGSTDYRITALEIGSIGTAVLAMPLTDVRDAVRAVSRIASIVGVVAALVVAATAWVIVRSQLRPIDAMVEIAEEIAAGDLTPRIDVSEPNTEVGHLGTALNTMLGQIQEGVEAKTASEARMRRFISDASHELRTPLTSIRGYAELHERGALDEAGVKQAFDRIGDEARRMGALVEDLLTLARLDQMPELTVVEADIAELVRESVQDARVVEPHRSIRFEEPAETLVAAVDADRVRQAVGNLLTNARVHTPRDAAITVSATREQGGIAISVIDKGPGLAPRQAERVFDRFYQAQPDRSTSGSGLGLAIVQSIAEVHGGSVCLKSVRGEGTTVTIRLPTEPG